MSRASSFWQSLVLSLEDLANIRPHFWGGGGTWPGGGRLTSHKICTLFEVCLPKKNMLTTGMPMVLRINGLFHPYKIYKGRLVKTSRK